MTTVNFWFYCPFTGARVEWSETYRFRWWARYVAFAANIMPAEPLAAAVHACIVDKAQTEMAA